MATVLKPPQQPDTTRPERPRRSAWRQRLVEAERGVTLGLRGDSTLFVHLFVGCVILTTAVVLGLSIIEWAVLILALAIVISAEMFNKVMIELGRLIPYVADDTSRNCLKIATAAVFVTMTGSMLAIGLIFARNLWLLFQT